MCLPNPKDLGLEAFLAFIHFCWTGGWFCVGHWISMPIYNCRSGWNSCVFFEPIGLSFMLGASVIYFFIMRHVANFIYKKELPGGAALTKELQDQLSDLISSKTFREAMKKKSK